MYNSSLTHVDKKYYIQTNVRDLLSIKSSFQKNKLYFLYWGVELFLKDEFILFKNAASGLPVPYGNYGNLMRIILYHCTKDVEWIKTLPESQPALGIQSMRDRMIDEANLDFEQSQTYLDRASSLERKAQEQSWGS